MNLQFDVHIDDPVIVYALDGKITTEEDFAELEAEVFKNLNQNYYRIVFDVANLTHTNSMGISFFMRTLTKARIMNGELVLASLDGNVKKIFDIAKLNEVYTIYPSTELAIKHFK
ncbi:MAG: STAS domain-containing protein [bacterium]|nr:STAS domain-containing protein [bacterium]